MFLVHSFLTFLTYLPWALNTFLLFFFFFKWNSRSEMCLNLCFYSSGKRDYEYLFESLNYNVMAISMENYFYIMEEKSKKPIETPTLKTNSSAFALRRKKWVLLGSKKQLSVKKFSLKMEEKNFFLDCFFPPLHLHRRNRNSFLLPSLGHWSHKNVTWFYMKTFPYYFNKH